MPLEGFTAGLHQDHDQAGHRLAKQHGGHDGKHGHQVGCQVATQHAAHRPEDDRRSSQDEAEKPRHLASLDADQQAQDESGGKREKSQPRQEGRAQAWEGSGQCRHQAKEQCPVASMRGNAGERDRNPRVDCRAVTTASTPTQERCSMTRPTASCIAVAMSLCIASFARAQQATPADDASRMLAMHAHDTPAASGAVHRPRGEVVSDTVVYATVDGKPVRGFRSRPRDAKKDAPAIILVHEWWGLNDNIRGMAAQYAGEGYVALAVDLYGTVAPTPDSAAKLYRFVMENPEPARANLSGAIDFLRSQGAKKVGTVGWCFGGHWSLEAGLVGGSRVQAVVMYYGQPITDPRQRNSSTRRCSGSLAARTRAFRPIA